MKRFRIIACITAMIIVMSATFAFAGEAFKLEDTYPENGQDHTSVENMGVKLNFNKPVDKNKKANDKCFKIVDKEGKPLPLRVIYDDKDQSKVLVLVDVTKVKSKGKKNREERKKEEKMAEIKDDASYTLKISKDFKNNDGETLGKNEEITFKTMNQSQNNKVYMIMMVVMMVGMFWFSSRQAKKTAEEYGPEKKEEPFNPYKESKRTGKSVEEVLAEHEKKVEKENRKKAKKAKKAAKEKAKEKALYEKYGCTREQLDPTYFRVKGPRPMKRSEKNVKGKGKKK